MNRIFLSLLLISGLLSCHLDDTQNNYTITGKIAWPGGDIDFNQALTVYLLKGDQVVSTSHESPFTFSNLQEGINYTILPVSTAEGRNGISTLDFVEIEKRIQGIIEFNLFQEIAADANRDHVIDNEDLQIIRDCILQSPKLYDCPSYRFVSEEHTEDSFSYIDQYVTGKLFADHEISFIPVKIGDINNTINP
ncbi:MAG TPA: hypothetical protein VGK46_06415 [Saprospiraceae bacterium]